MAGLTAKQESACLKYLECGDKSEAYRHAYNTSNMKPETINRNAHALFKNNKIATRVAELQAKIERRTEITVEKILKQLEEDREFARRLANPSSAVRVTELLGKHLGMFVDRFEGNLTVKGPLVIVRKSKEGEDGAVSG